MYKERERDDLVCSNALLRTGRLHRKTTDPILLVMRVFIASMCDENATDFRSNSTENDQLEMISARSEDELP